MVAIVTTPEGFGNLENVRKRLSRETMRGIVEITYDQLLEKRSAPAGLYAFADRERMTPELRLLAGELWEALSKHPRAIRLYNDPRHQLGRYELLQALHDRGVNDFAAYRLDELDERVRFPVFVRRENDHAGPRTELIPDRDTLALVLSQLILGCLPAESLIVVEFLDTSGPDGIFRKYGALRAGDRVYGHHLMLCRNWAAKHRSRLVSPEADAENDAYSTENPHAERLMEIFEIAGIQYGRIDYSLRDGKIQVWEINDNPMYLSANPRGRPETLARLTRFFETLKSQASGLSLGERVPLELDPERAWSLLAGAAHASAEA